MNPTLEFLWATVLREWVWEQFVHGFCVHLVRPLVLVLVFAITFLGFGKSVGLPALFLRSKWHERFLIGAGVGVLVWQAVLAGYLFEEFATNYTLDRPPFCEVRPVSGPVWPWDTATPSVYDLNPNAEWYDDLRYRYVPASVWSVLRYAGNVGAAAAAVLFLAWLAATLRWVLRKLVGSRPTAGWGLDFTYFRLRAGFVLGVAAGFAFPAWVSGYFLPGQFVHAKSFTDKPDRRRVELSPLHTAAYQTGEWFVNLGGWGNAAARNAAFDQAAPDDTGGPPKDQAESRNEERYRLEPYYPVYGVFFLGFAALLVWNVGLLVFTRRFSPAAGVLLILHILLAGQTFIEYFFAAPTLFLLVLGGLLVLFAGRYKVRFPGLTGYYRNPLPLQKHYDAVRTEVLPPPGPPPQPIEPEPFAPLLASQLKRWNIKDPEEKKPLVVVCVSGGGSRAAAWTMKVLTTLEEQLPGFPYHVRLFTGASGGMFGAAYYTASLPPPDKKRLPEIAVEGLPSAASGAYPSRRHLNDTVRGDFLSPVVRALVKNDLLRPFQPFAFGGDRGAALEQTWSECLGGWLDRSFADLWQGERDGWRPSLAFSPMLVEDGRQLVISNLSLRRAMVNLGREPGGADDVVLSREGVELFKLFESCGHTMATVRKQLKLSTAARMSATFPYLFPAVPLPTHPRRRVVDAGYYDNYGVCLAAGWLFTHSGWLKANVSRVAVINIRDGVSTGERLMHTPAPDARTAFGLAAEGLTTPPAGLNASRTAAGTFRNDNLLHLLTLFFREREVPFVTAAFEFPGGADVSLNFCLPPEEAELIDGDKGIKHPDVTKALAAFGEWWNA